jgi:hypothetical protein
MLQSLQNVLKNKDNVVLMGSAVVVCLIGVFIGNNLHNHNDDNDTGTGSNDEKPGVVSEIIKNDNDSADSVETDKKFDSLNDEAEKGIASTDNLKLNINDITGDKPDITGDNKPDITSIDSSDITSIDSSDITSDDKPDITSDDTNINKTNNDSTTAKGISSLVQSQNPILPSVSPTTTNDATKISMDDLINNNDPQQSSNPFANENLDLPQSNPFANENSVLPQGSPSSIPISSSLDTALVNNNSQEKKPVVLEETGGKNRSKKHRKNKKSKKSRKHNK